MTLLTIWIGVRQDPFIFPNLKATSRTISIRLPESLIEEIKVLANKQDVPYQSMLKILLADKVREKNTAHRGKRESRLTSRSS